MNQIRYKLIKLEVKREIIEQIAPKFRNHRDIL